MSDATWAALWTGLGAVTLAVVQAVLARGREKREHRVSLYAEIEKLWIRLGERDKTIDDLRKQMLDLEQQCRRLQIEIEHLQMQAEDHLGGK